MSHTNATFNMPRRRFLVASAAALGIAPMAFLRAQSGSPNEEIAIGLVGCGGMGVGDMNNFLHMPGCRVVAVCDPDANAMNGAKGRVDGHYKNQDCKTYQHFRELIAHPGLDAVICGTPDHMHASVGIAAANAGKHVYGEKPFTWGLREGRMLVDAVKKNKVVYQTGSQQRSGGEFRRFRALIQNNTIGKITRIECGTPSGMSVQQHLPEDQWAAHIGKPPAHLDWKTYCGPVKDYPYHPMIHPWNWRWTNALGGGQLLDWVGHHVDIGLWALGLDQTGPVKVEATGELGNHKFFDTYVKYQYQGTFADGRVVEVRSDFMGTKITGEKGWLHVDRGRLDASDREMLRNLPADFDPKIPGHHQDFINCIREGRFNTASEPEGCHRSASFGMLAIVAMDTKQPLRWNPETEQVIDNAEQSSHPRLGARIES
jgi:predicted dehydrogenase